MGDKQPLIENTTALDVESGKVDEKQLGALTAQVMNNPQILAAMQSKLAGMVGMPSGYNETLPNVIKRRVKALKKLQIERIKIEGQFFREVHELEVKYGLKYEPLYKKRTYIITGVYEPNDSECDYTSDNEESEEDYEVVTEEKPKTKKEDTEEEKKTKGIPEFWLTIFKNVYIIRKNNQEYDETILQHLKDVRVILSRPGFKLEFVFEANEYFENEILTKEYELKCDADLDDPWSYDGIAIVKVKGENVTENTVNKKQKHKSMGQVRTVNKTFKNDSFFNFSNTPEVPENVNDLDDETHAVLQADREIGEVIRQSVVPRAVQFFTGEAMDGYDEEEEESDAYGEQNKDFSETLGPNSETVEEIIVSIMENIDLKVDTEFNKVNTLINSMYKKMITKDNLKTMNEELENIKIKVNKIPENLILTLENKPTSGPSISNKRYDTNKNKRKRSDSLNNVHNSTNEQLLVDKLVEKEKPPNKDINSFKAIKTTEEYRCCVHEIPNKGYCGFIKTVERTKMKSHWDRYHKGLRKGDKPHTKGPGTTYILVNIPVSDVQTLKRQWNEIRKNNGQDDEAACEEWGFDRCKPFHQAYINFKKFKKTNQNN